jgi:4-hydroxy-2-oxoheptanedioate aldolase
LPRFTASQLSNPVSPSFVRQKIAQGEIVLTAKSCYADPEVVELMASSGFDAIWICFEHKRVDPAVACSLIQACRLGGADALIRMKPSNHTDLLWLLEAGARGIMLPRVRHPDEVQAVLTDMKFFPQGRRGADVVHADSNFGRAPMTDYMAASNRETFLVVQIEEPDVVPHLDAIAAMPGVDVLFVGPGDLALGLGKMPSAADPDVMAIARKVADACRRHGKRAGIPCAADQLPLYRELGFTFFNVISDYRCVANGVKQALATARSSF